MAEQRINRKKILFDVFYAGIAAGLLFGVWAIASLAVDSEFILPGIGDTFVALGNVFLTPAFFTGLLGTLLRSLSGYAISVALFFVLFYASSVSDGARRIIEPVVSVLRTLPTMAVSLILAIWAGANFAPVILGVAVITPVLYSGTRARLTGMPKELVETSKIFGAGRNRVFIDTALPYAAAAFPENMSSAFSFNIKIVVAAEILMQTAKSLGMLMYMSQIYFRTAELIALVFVTVVVSVAAERVLRLVLNKALKHYI